MSNPESGALGSRCRESSRAKLIYILVFESVSIGNRVDSEPNGKCSVEMFGAARGTRPPGPVKVLGPCPHKISTTRTGHTREPVLGSKSNPP